MVTGRCGTGSMPVVGSVLAGAGMNGKQTKPDIPPAAAGAETQADSCVKTRLHFHWSADSPESGIVCSGD